MKEEIINTAGQMFLTLGVKSVTMDDVSSSLGVSKKTLYKFFGNKTELVESCMDMSHNSCVKDIVEVQSLHLNPVEEKFKIKSVFNERFKDAGSSPVYQLKKYYPLIHKKMMDRQSAVFANWMLSNLKKGIQDGFYRKDIPIESCVNFYKWIVFGIYDNTSDVKKSISLEKEALVYHIRAIATEKGIKELENQINI